MSLFRTGPVLRATKTRLSGISPFIVRLDTLPGRPVSKYDYWFWKLARPPFQRLPVTNSDEDYTELRRKFVKALRKKPACLPPDQTLQWRGSSYKNRVIMRAKSYVPVQFSWCDRWPSSGGIATTWRRYSKYFTHYVSSIIMVNATSPGPTSFQTQE